MWRVVALLAGAVLGWAPSPGAAFNMLVLHPLHSGSHEVQLRHLALTLAERGHSVTYLKFKNFVQLPPLPHPNITSLTLAVDNTLNTIPYVTPEKEGRFMLPLDVMWENGLSPWGVPLDAFLTVAPFCERLLGDAELRQRLHEQRFDLALVDLFTNECGLALAHALHVPAVAYWALPVSGGEAVLSAGVSAPHGAAPAFMTGYSDTMTFAQRAVNLFYGVMNGLVMRVQCFISDRVIQKHMPGAPTSHQLLANISGLLENTDFSVDYPKEYPPNVINVGCMQCRDPQPLPQELEEWMQGSGANGVVLFSMGATFDASIAPPALLRSLLNAFSRLRQRVLMKVSGALPADVEIPANVRVERWLPQQDILGHAKTRLFFTHCGLHGAMEAVWHAVPQVALPVYGDQLDVANLLVHRGVALLLPQLKNANADQIHKTLTAVLYDPRFSRRASDLQRLMHDQLSTPLERAVWFVEHAARTRGAAHLKVASRNLSPLQKHAIDVLLVALAALVFAILVLRKLASRLITRATQLETKNTHLAQHSLKSPQLKQE